MHVRVFRNLTNRCLSIQALVPHPATGKLVWRTVAHAQHVALSDVVFRVSAAGRRRVIATGKKTVHAWAQGTLSSWVGVTRMGTTKHGAGFCADLVARRIAAVPPVDAWGCPIAVTYNPHRFASFVTKATHEAIEVAEWCRLDTAHGVACYAPRGPIAA